MIFPYFLRNFEDLWVSFTWGSLFTKGSEHFLVVTVWRGSVGIYEVESKDTSQHPPMCGAALFQKKKKKYLPKMSVMPKLKRPM